MGTHSATTSDESQLSVSSKKLISSRSSSADSTDAFENDLDRPSVSNAGFSPNHDYFNQHTPDSTHPTPNSVSSNVGSDSSRNLQPPAVQSMENPAGNASPYRIPSSVFARTNAAPGEWSTASNESLFSIQMGNMSFTRDFAQYLGKSGELGMYRKSGELSMYKKSGELSMYKKSGELGTDMRPAERNKSRDLGVSGELPTSMRPTTTGEMMNLSNIPQSAYQACPDSHPGVRATEAAAAETMKEVIRENEQNRGEIKVPSKNNGSRSPTSSDDGGASVKSFAFPVSGDSVKNGSEDISLRPQKSSQRPQQPPDSTQRTISKEKLAAQQVQATSWFPCCWPVRS